MKICILTGRICALILLIRCTNALQVNTSSSQQKRGRAISKSVRSSQISESVVLQGTKLKTPGRRAFDVLTKKPSLTTSLPMTPGTNNAGLTSGLTSGFISQLAIFALKRRLKAQTSVECEVTASSTDLLLKGSAGPATVRGRGWRSGLGLTCRVIEATVDSCELDTAKLLSHQKLVFKRPAKGRSMIALNAEDFSNFINHPLTSPPFIDGVASAISFIKDGVEIDPKRNTVTFHIEYQDRKYRCNLRRGKASHERALVDVTPDDSTSESCEEVLLTKLSESLSTFFNELVFDLDGVSLSFRDMMITNKGEAPSIMLSLNIIVRKFPSLNVAF